MNDLVDMLQIKIEAAKGRLSENTRRAIDAVDFKKTILDMRMRKGYTFEQIGDLEVETELLLCGLLSSEDYPKELEKRMQISKHDTEELVREMNDLVFKKIREEFIKETERKNAPEQRMATLQSETTRTLESNINIIKSNTVAVTPANLETLELTDGKGVRTLQGDMNMIKTNKVAVTPARVKIEEEKSENDSLLAQRLSGSFRVPVAKSQYSLNSAPELPDEEIPKHAEGRVAMSYPKNADPYRINPEE